jgi:uncharacterized protein
MQSLLDPAILFFLFALFAGAVKSNLEIPPQISRFLSLYLLMALGLKGGFALAKSGLTTDVATSLGCAILLAIIVPAISYRVLRRVLSGFDAAAVAATYGSVSAVTFITAVQYLESLPLAYGGHMAAAMALMESPAIIMAVLFANSLRQQTSVNASDAASIEPMPGKHTTIGKLLHESLTDGAQLLLLGGMLIGVITGEAGKAIMQPFSVDLFKGMLAFFLLDMGLLAARNLSSLRTISPWLIAYAIVGPLFHATLALALATVTGLSPGDGALLMTLAASASYIAVPAALRYAIPEAKPSLYLGLGLGLTFPFNILVGIPLYTHIAQTMLH